MGEKQILNHNRKNKNIKEILSWIKTICLTVVIVYIINNGLIVNAFIPTSSMENTIMTGDRLVANRLAYLNDEPKRGEIIVFKYPDDESKLYVKRIIGLPGEEIKICEGKVYVNGIVLPEEYLSEEMIGEFGPYTVPKDHYFMLGDNRNGSEDSRMWNEPYLSKDNIIGKVLFRYYPSFKGYNQ